jgi:hypothetical protein
MGLTVESVSTMCGVRGKQPGGVVGERKDCVVGGTWMGSASELIC